MDNHIDLMLKNTDAVLFDLDGTLIDSMGVWGKVDRIYLARYDIECPPDLTRTLSGISISQAAAYFRDVFKINEPESKMIADWNELARDQYSNHVLPKESAIKWLDEIRSRGIRMAVGTSNTRELAETVIRKRNLAEYFDIILTGEDVKIGKPDPYIYLKAAHGVGADPSRCIVFEDIVQGLIAGKAAGMRTCGVYDQHSEYQETEKREAADYYINGFEDIFTNKVQILKNE